MDYYDGMAFSDSDDERFAMSGGFDAWAMDDDDDGGYARGYGHRYRYGQDGDGSEDDEMDDDDEDDAMVARASRRYGHGAPPPPPPPPLPAPTPTLCRFFVLGKCRFGSRCTFSHTLPAASGSGDEDAMARAATTVDCPYFLRGKCKYGRSCRLRHASAGQSGDDPQLDSLLAAARASVGTGARAQGAAAPPRAASTGNQQEVTCGICFEDIVEAGKHFGLLSCDHCYCLDCLRAWRQSKEQEVEVTRACPACRVPSNFIVPSLTFCTGAQKNAVVEEYKRHLAFRECKYFDGSLGSCPFGPNCFYAHRNALGEDVKHRDRPRRRRSESAGSAASSSISGGGRSRRGSGGRRPLPEAVASILERYSEFFRLMQSLDWDDRGSQQDTH